MKPLLLACAFVAAMPAVAATDPDSLDHLPLQGVLNVWLENDLMVRTDQHYTHGSRIAYTTAEKPLDPDTDWIARAVHFLPSPAMDPASYRTSLALTQNIYTPRDISIPTIIPEERPYAGWLYATLGLQSLGRSAGNTPILDYWAINLGVVGPASLAEQAQNGIHGIRDIEKARGWDNQLRNEPDIGIRYGRGLRYRATLSESVAGEFLPFAGAQLGTVQTFASIGTQWRIGYNLPTDFGWRSIDDVLPATGGRQKDGSNPRGIYIFWGVEARYYGHNMLVEGNLLHDSHWVQIQPLLGEFKIGLVYSGKRWDIAYTHMVRSKEFRTQEDADSFGSLSLAYKW